MQPQPAAPRPPSSRARFSLLPAVPRAMTRCECTGLGFEQITRRMAAEGKSLEQLMAETGAGRNCTGCLPDLREFVARFRADAD